MAPRWVKNANGLICVRRTHEGEHHAAHCGWIDRRNSDFSAADGRTVGACVITMPDGEKENFIEGCCKGSCSKIQFGGERIIFYLSQRFDTYIESHSGKRRNSRVRFLLVFLLPDPSAAADAGRAQDGKWCRGRVRSASLRSFRTGGATRRAHIQGA